MGIGVHRDTDLGVTENIHDRLGWHPGGKLNVAAVAEIKNRESQCLAPLAQLSSHRRSTLAWPAAECPPTAEDQAVILLVAAPSKRRSSSCRASVPPSLRIVASFDHQHPQDDASFGLTN
jgi:hypothetical protein